MSGSPSVREIIDNEGVQCSPAPTCLLCEQERPVLYPKQRDRFFSAPGVWNIRWCRPCELAWLDPRPLAQEVAKLYSEYYTHQADADSRGGPRRTLRRWLRDGILASWMGYEELADSRLQRSLGKLVGYLWPIRDVAELAVMTLRAEQRGRVLDVGCGNGNFLWQLRALGWQVSGIEPDRAAARVAQERFGIEVHVGSIGTVEIAERFDAIVLNHVVEHLHAPIGDLAKCGNWLSEGGVLVIATPNIAGVGHRYWRAAWRGLEVPRHLFIFSKKSLRRVLAGAGLRVVMLRTSSRIAAWTWQVSSVAAWEQGRRRAERAQVRRMHKLLGKLVQVAEALPGIRRFGGEELIAVCRRDGAGRGSLSVCSFGMVCTHQA